VLLPWIKKSIGGNSNVSLQPATSNQQPATSHKLSQKTKKPTKVSVILYYDLFLRRISNAYPNEDMQKSIKLLVFFLLVGLLPVYGQHGETTHEDTGQKATHTEEVAGHEADHGDAHDEHHAEYDPKNVAYHHIGNQNVYSIGSWALPLPCILYAPEKGWDVFMSSKFDIGHHGTGHYAYNGYVLKEGSVFRIPDPEFPQGKVHLDKVKRKMEDVNGKMREVIYAVYHGEEIKTDARTTYLGNFLGGGPSSFYDFSVTKNVIFMIIVAILMLWMFISIANAYKKREGMAPKGMQSFFEPIILFVRDEVAKPFIGAKYGKYLPFLLTLFFFILFLNLLGQVPFLGNTNVTGNLTFTMVLALVTFFVVNLSGKKAYWEHIVWMPGAPWWVKATVLTPVEILGMFIKPFTLMLRLFANITAGHMVVLTFVGLIFIFGKSGESMGGVAAGIGLALPLTLFMMALEVLVAFIQAFVFTMLAASYIGAAIEEHH
jgi:F-type H+-transporting ATPase subunit a